MKIKILYTVLILPLIFLGIGCASPNEVSAYPVSCSEEAYTKGACTSWSPFNRTTYRIDKDKQDVLSWMPEIDSVGTNRYTKCAIINIDQWSCKYDDGSGEFGFSGGKYFQTPAAFHHVTKEEWEGYYKNR